MNATFRHLWRSGFAALLLGGLVSTTAAQDANRTSVDPGWLGLNYHLDVVREGRARNTVVIVTGTAINSPARMAGVQAGDTVWGIGGRRLTLESWAELTENVTAGEEVRLTLQRDGRRREILLEAARRERAPTAWSFGFSDRLASQADSLRKTLERRFNETRARLQREPGYITVLLAGDSATDATIQIVQDARRGFAYSFRTRSEGEVSNAPNSVSFRIEEPPNPLVHAPSDEPLVAAAEALARIRLDTLRAVTWVTTPQVYTLDGRYRLSPVTALPFEYMELKTPEADLLKGAYVQIRSEIAELQMARRSREMEIADEMVRHVRETERTDGVLSDLDGEYERFFVELTSLQERLQEMHEAVVRAGADAPEETGARARGVTVGPVPEVVVTTAPRPTARPAFTVSARLVGLNFVGGAQVATLNPSMSEYFGIDEGVLVMEVLDGTPASEAGLLPGDVIVRAGRTQIREVSELRRALAERRSGIRLRVVRKGEERTVRLPEE
jgi:PDZ domain